MNGLLLVNLGTPDAPTPGAVRRYLREFLSDPRVLDINPVGRALLLHGVILRVRPKKSAHAYQSIWGRGVDEGVSPLLGWSRRLTAAVAASLGETWRVALGMRYGNPSLASALDELQRYPLKKLIICPLYPQYASSSTGSTLERVMDLVKGLPVVPPVVVVRDFFDDPGFIDSVAEVTREQLASFTPDHVLFSFHGLPERHVKATDPTGKHCLASADCCARMCAANHACYRAQSHETARRVAERLGLADGAWSIAFQSRLGRTPWIRPYTDELLVELAQQRGVRRLMVVTPSFVSDCLETLEEIGIRADEDFRKAGGTDFCAVPCVNAHPRWVKALSRLVLDTAGFP